MVENETNPERLNWRQACEILGCGKSSLYRLVKNGILPVYGIGTRCRWFLKNDCEKIVSLENSNSMDYNKT